MPTTPADLDSLPFPERPPALFLDVDGTLVEIAARPQDVRVAADLPPLLGRLSSALGGALAFVSGRSLDDVDRLFGGLKPAGGGQHGLEMRDASGGVTRTFTDTGEIEEIAGALRSFTRSAPGTLLEEKGMTAALHYRNAPDREAEARALAEALMKRHGERFHVQEGKMVLEFKPRGADKGTVVDRLMKQPPFAGRMPIFAGDDVTDEHGFAAVNRLGGVSIQVGRREPTAALYRTGSVAALRGWLAALARRLEQQPG